MREAFLFMREAFPFMRMAESLVFLFMRGQLFRITDISTGSFFRTVFLRLPLQPLFGVNPTLRHQYSGDFHFARHKPAQLDVDVSTDVLDYA